MFTHSDETRSFPGPALRLLILGLIFITLSASAQHYPLRVNVTVMPPYSTRISDYINTPGKIIVTVMNTTAGSLGKTYSFYLLGSISCDAGPSVATDPSYVPPRAITLPPGQVYTLTVQDVQQLYSSNHLVYQGTSEKQILQDGGFPEGYYTICVKAFDFSTRQQLSDDAPSGCKSFMVSNIEAPILQKPVCGDTLFSNVQMITFSWSPPAGAPVTTMYRLRIVELLSKYQIAPDAFYTTPPNKFFETTTPAPVFVYSGAYPPLTDGRTYAFAVQAFDTKGNASFKNSGWSEICNFIYKKTPTNTGGITKEHKNDPGINAWDASVSGHLNYRFSGNNEEHPMKHVRVSLRVVYTIKNAQITKNGQTFTNSEMVCSGGPFSSPPLPDDNMAVRATAVTDDNGAFTLETTLAPKEPFGLLKKGYSTSTAIKMPVNPGRLDPDINGINSESGPGMDWGLIEDILKETGIDYTKLYETNGLNGLMQGITNSGIDIRNIMNSINAGQQHAMNGALGGQVIDCGTASGDFYRVLRVVVDDPYYNSPDSDFIPCASKHITVAQPLVGLVNTYKLKVKVHSDNTANQFAGKTTDMPDVSVEIGRQKGFPDEVPLEEGKPLYHRNTMVQDTLATLVWSDETEAVRMGEVFFDDLVRNQGVHTDPYQLYSYTSKKKGNKNYKTDRQILIFPSPSCFNSQFEVWEHTVDVTMHPESPRIAGRVMYKSFPVSGARCWTPVSKDSVHTDKNGYFELNPVTDFNHHAVLHIEKYGYEDYTNDYGIMALGQQVWNDGIELIPWGYITGLVQDMDGHPVEAMVSVDSLPASKTIAGGSQNPRPEQFSFRAPSGKRFLHVIPVSTDFMGDTFIVTLNKIAANEVPQDLGVFRLAKNKHRIKVWTFYKEIANSSGYSKKHPLPGCRVTINNINKTSDNNGFAYFEFVSPATEFKISVNPPPANPDYFTEDVILKNIPTRDTVLELMEMKEGLTVKGKVISDPEHNPVKDACVFIGDSGPGPKLTTFSLDDGTFALHGVPKELMQAYINATKHDESITWVGDRQQIKTDLTLVLKHVDDIDLTYLLGFPVELSAYEKQNDGTAMIDGYLKPEGNNLFIPFDNQFRLAFHKLQVKKLNTVNNKGIHFAEPASGEIMTDNNSMELRCNKFFVKQGPEIKDNSNIVYAKIKVTKLPDGNGMIRGRAGIEKNSFSLASGLFDFTEGKAFSLFDPGTGSLNILTLLGKNAPLQNVRLGLCNPKGSDMPLKFLGFSAVGKTSGSYIENDSIILDLTLKPGLKGLVSLSLNVGKVGMTGDAIRQITLLHPSDLTLSEKWKIQTDKLHWENGQNGFYGTNNKLKTGFADIPAKVLDITSDNLQMDGFSFSNLQIGNTCPINIDPKADFLFYYDPEVGEMGKPHYVVKILGKDDKNPVAHLGNLPGNPGTLDMNSIQVLDNDEQLYAGLENSKPLNFYNIFPIKVNQITGYNDHFTMTGIYDLNLPRIPAGRNASILVYKNQKTGTPVVSFVPMILGFDGPGGVNFTASQVAFSDTIFTDTFQCKGKLKFSERNYSKTLDAILVKQPNQAYITISPLDQRLPMGTGTDCIALTNVNGEMRVKSSDWDNFWFKGTIANAKNAGKQSESNKFIVRGSISSEGNMINADNMPGLPGVKLTYDLEKNLLIGVAQLEKVDLFAFKVSGTLNLLFSSNDWYFDGSVDMVSPDPILQEISVGLVLGNMTTVPDSVKTLVLSSTMNKDWPSTLGTGLKGFFFTGFKSILPPASFKAGFYIGRYLVGYKVSAEAGADARFWMDFSNNATILGFGLMLYGDADARLGAYMGSICPYIEGGVHLGFGIPEGTYNFTTKSLYLHGQAYIGMRLNGGVCLGPICSPCFSTSFSKLLNCNVIIETATHTKSFDISLSDRENIH